MTRLDQVLMHAVSVQAPYVGNFLFRPAGTNELEALVRPLAQLSLKMNELLGIYDDARRLAQRPPWQQTVVERMHEKGWSLDLRCWAEYQSLAWIAAGRRHVDSSQFCAAGYRLPPHISSSIVPSPATKPPTAGLSTDVTALRFIAVSNRLQVF